MRKNEALPSSSSTPSCRRISISLSTCPNTRTAYSRSTSEDGCMSLLANSPSVVNSNKPSVLMSSRPIMIQRPARIFGRASKTVLRPSGSCWVQTSPAGLLYISTLGVAFRREPRCRRCPRILIWSCSSTACPTVAGWPFTRISPAAIERSISRREP